MDPKGQALLKALAELPETLWLTGEHPTSYIITSLHQASIKSRLQCPVQASSEGAHPAECEIGWIPNTVTSQSDAFSISLFFAASFSQH